MLFNTLFGFCNVFIDARWIGIGNEILGLSLVVLSAGPFGQRWVHLKLPVNRVMYGTWCALLPSCCVPSGALAFDHFGMMHLPSLVETGYP